MRRSMVHVTSSRFGLHAADEAPLHGRMHEKTGTFSRLTLTIRCNGHCFSKYLFGFFELLEFTDAFVGKPAK